MSVLKGIFHGIMIRKVLKHTHHEASLSSASPTWRWEGALLVREGRAKES